MIKLLSYSGITTKIRAMEANFISNEDYQKIASFETVTEFITFLKNHPGYRNIFHGLDENTIHRGQAEDILINSLYIDFSKLYQFATIEQRKDLNLVFFRYEINILKDCLQLVYRGSSDYSLPMFAAFFDKHSSINVKALAASHTMDEYIANLKGTPYHHLLLLLQNTNHLSPFDYEMQLDIYYFKKLWKLKDRLLSGNNLKSVTSSIGTEIDLLNIMWLYRSKKYYDIPSSDTYGYIIPINYKLSKEQLSKLMNTVTLDEFAAIIKTTIYKEFTNSIMDGSIESLYSRKLSNLYLTNTVKYPNSMAPVNYYLYEKQCEINRLTTALECIRYKLEPQDTLRYVL